RVLARPGSQFRSSNLRSSSRHLHRPCHGPRHSPPILGFFRKFFAPSRRKRVVLGPAIVFRRTPLGRQQPLPLQPVQCRVERPFFHVQNVVRAFMDPFCHAKFSHSHKPFRESLYTPKCLRDRFCFLPQEVSGWPLPGQALQKGVGVPDFRTLNLKILLVYSLLLYILMSLLHYFFAFSACLASVLVNIFSPTSTGASKSPAPFASLRTPWRRLSAASVPRSFLFLPPSRIAGSKWVPATARSRAICLLPTTRLP